MAKLWYALMMDSEDSDWGTGTFDREEAIAKCKAWREGAYPDAYIAVIDDGDTPVCIEEIRDFE